MTKVEILKMAAEAAPHPFDESMVFFSHAELERFYHLAVTAEREACEEACDELIGDGSSPPDWNQGVLSAIEAIRARSQS